MSWTNYACPYCGAANDLDVDPSAGRRQKYVEDCQNCCRPILLAVELDADGDPAVISAEPENG